MRGILIIAAITAITTTAAAQSTWQEYTYPTQQFAVSFPAEPTVTTASFNANGAMVPETIYSVQQDTGVFRLAVIDFTNTGIDRMAAIDQAAMALGQNGDVRLNMQARVQRNYGRYLNIAGTDEPYDCGGVFRQQPTLRTRRYGSGVEPRCAIGRNDLFSAIVAVYG